MERNGDFSFKFTVDDEMFRRFAGYASQDTYDKANENLVQINRLPGWSAPEGWDDYNYKGEMAGSKIMIDPGQAINTRVFEVLKFEMV